MAGGSRILRVEILGDAKGLGGAFKDAEGSAKKLETGFGDLEVNSSKNMLNVNKAIAGAAAAVGAFAVSGVREFEKLGIEVGKFSDATGLSAEESSRWIEVAGDLGIESGTLEAALNKMNVAAGKAPEEFAKFGVEIARTDQGAVDANKTFLNTIDRLNQIEDPAKRAEAGTKLLGRGWKETAELVGRGSEQITKDLNAVAGNKVFTDADVSEARGLRGAFDSIGDAVDELQLKIGKTLAPVIVDLAGNLVEVVDAVGPLVDIIGEALVGALKNLKPLLEGVGGAVETVTDLMYKGSTSIVDMNEVLDANEDVLKDAGVNFLALFEKVNRGQISVADFEKVVEDAGGTMAVTGKVAAFIKGDFHNLTAATKDSTFRISRNTVASEAWAAVVDSSRVALAKSRVAAEEQAAALDLSQQAAARARDRQNELDAAARRVEDAVRRQNAEWDALTGDLDKEEAFLNLAQQFDDLETKINESKTAMDAGTLSAEQGMRDVALEIIATKKEVVAYGTELGAMPTEITTLLKLIDNGDIDAVEQRLNIMARNRTMQLSIVAKGGVGYVPIGTPQFADGGVVPGPRGSPVLAMVHAGETILPTHKYTDVGGGGMQVTIIQQPGESAEQLVQKLDQYARRNGITWRNGS